MTVARRREAGLAADGEAGAGSVVTQWSAWWSVAMVMQSVC